MKKLFTKIKNKTTLNFQNTLKTTKYMLNYIWCVEDGKKYILLKSFVSILTAVLPIGLVFMPGLIINELSGEQRIDILIIYISITVLIPLIQSVVTSFLNVYINSLRYTFMIKVKINFIGHCADMDFENLEKPNIQILKERAEETTTDALDTFEYLSSFVSSIISVIMCASVISILNPLLLVLILIVVGINYLNSRWISKKNYLINNKIGEYNRYGWPIVNYFSNLKYAKEIRLYNLKDYFTKLYSDNSSVTNKLGVKNSIYQRNSNIIGSLVSLFQTIILYSYFVYQVIENELAVGNMTIYMGTIMQFTDSLANVTRQYLNLSMLSLRVQELITFLQIPLNNFNTGNKVPTYDENSIIEFKNVSFKYPGSDRYALKKLNITIRGNEKLCIVGENGSGKSTFIKLLTRLYMPCEGEILLNGININEYDYLQYNKLFSPVFQDFSLYNISLSENIVMAERFDYDRLTFSVEQSGLSSVVNNNKHGYDTIIYKWFDEEGIEPSGGEGQKIAIARALYHGRPIYILDEPTAALDPNAEYEIYTQFSNMITGKCAIFVTHRLSAVQLADKVAVFEDGQVVEYGTPQELYVQGGIYTDMFNKQAKFYIESNNE